MLIDCYFNLGLMSFVFFKWMLQIFSKGNNQVSHCWKYQSSKD